MIVIDHGFEDFFRELDQLVGKEVAVFKQVQSDSKLD